MSSRILHIWIEELRTKLQGCSGRWSRSAAGSAQVTRKLHPILELLEDRMTPATLVVSLSTPDSASVSGTLPYAIAHAHNGDTITFAPDMNGATIVLNSALTIDRDVTITGLGAANLAISGNNATQIFSVPSGVTASISGLTIENGQAGVLIANGETAGSGGGILNAGRLTLSNDTFSGNSTGQIGVGGAIANAGGSLTLHNDLFTGNSAEFGGGIDNLQGTATLADVTFQDNSASYDGGGIANSGTMIVDGATITGNTGGGGGGIDNTFWSAVNVNGSAVIGTLTLSNTTISDNCAFSGAGIQNVTAIAFISDTTITDNSAPFGRAAGINNSDLYFQNYEGSPFPGFAGLMTVSNSTISDNSAYYSNGGIVTWESTLSLSNSTVSGNVAPFGGGINSGAGLLTVNNSTVTGNSGGGIISGNGYENQTDDTVTVSNSTITDGISSTGYLTVINSNVSGNYVAFSFEPGLPSTYRPPPPIEITLPVGMTITPGNSILGDGTLPLESTSNPGDTFATPGSLSDTFTQVGTSIGDTNVVPANPVATPVGTVNAPTAAASGPTAGNASAPTGPAETLVTNVNPSSAISTPPTLLSAGTSEAEQSTSVPANTTRIADSDASLRLVEVGPGKVVTTPTAQTPEANSATSVVDESFYQIGAMRPDAWNEHSFGDRDESAYPCTFSALMDPDSTPESDP